MNESDGDKEQDEHEKVMATTNKMNIKKAMMLKNKINTKKDMMIWNKIKMKKIHN